MPSAHSGRPLNTNHAQIAKITRLCVVVRNTVSMKVTASPRWQYGDRVLGEIPRLYERSCRSTAHTRPCVPTAALPAAANPKSGASHGSSHQMRSSLAASISASLGGKYSATSGFCSRCNRMSDNRRPRLWNISILVAEVELAQRINDTQLIFFKQIIVEGQT